MSRREEKLDGLGQPLDPTTLYYVQDKRQMVGNCVLWWTKEAMGYTTQLEDAGLFSADDVAGMRETDVPWPREVVRETAVTHVRMEPLRRLREQLRQKEVLGG